MSPTWFFDIENNIYTIVKTRTERKLLAKYPKLQFTSDDSGGMKAKFPTVYIHWLPGYEMARELNNEDVNAFLCTAQMEVYTNKEQGQKVAKHVMAEVIKQFVTLGFEINSMPEFLSTDNDTKRIVARARRTLASGDILNSGS